jgi:hypothetical protein
LTEEVDLRVRFFVDVDCALQNQYSILYWLVGAPGGSQQAALESVEVKARRKKWFK